MDKLSNNKRIAKNTLFLYIRMALIMLITLYTSRIILEYLGIDDYGIYNVVGGLATIFSFLTSPMANTSNRFLSYTLGKNDFSELSKLFGTLRSMHIILGLIVCVLLLLIGPWFIYNKLDIPADKMNAAIWVFVLSTFSVFIMVVSLPYNALIIAHEKMKAFAVISLIEVSLKLGVAFLITIDMANRLIFYAVLLLLTNLIIRIIYSAYCVKHFKESNAPLSLDRTTVKDIYNFGVWMIIGCLSVVGFTQGLNIILNIFFGPAINAARGIAVQVQGVCSQFNNNFQTAFKPQIIKSYASEEYDYMHKLIIYCSKYSFLVLLLIVVPVCYFTPSILKIWLGYYPPYTVSFIRIILLTSMSEILKFPIIQALQATGDVKRFHIIEGILLMSIVPIAYFGFKYGGITDPNYAFYVFLVVELITQVVRVIIILPRINMSILYYIKKIILPIAFVIIPIGIVFLFVPKAENFGMLILYCIATEVFITILSLLFAVPKTDRIFIVNKLKQFIRH